MGGYQQLFTAAGTLKRKDGMSSEDFFRYYSQDHFKLSWPTIKKYGVKSYTQLHISHPTLTNAFGGMVPTLEYDAIGTFVFEDEASFIRFMSDPAIGESIIPDGLMFSQPDKTFWVVGRQYVLIEDGEPVVET